MLLEAVADYWRPVDDAVCLLEAREAGLWRSSAGEPAMLRDVETDGTRFLDLPGEASFAVHGMGLTAQFANGQSVTFDLPRDATISSDLWKIRGYVEQTGTAWLGFDELRAVCATFALTSPVQQVSERGVFEVDASSLHRWHAASAEGRA